MSSAAGSGRRAASKHEKQRRIIAAARRVFDATGFERATTHEIAHAAGVAVGTLFLYARDKRELLLLVVSDELEAVTEQSISALVDDRPLVDQLVDFYRRRIEYFAGDVELARIVLSEVYASRAPEAVGSELARAWSNLDRLLAALAEKLALYARRHDLALRDDPLALAEALHALYMGALWRWLNTAQPSAAEALAALRRAFTLVVEGAIRS